MTKIILVDDQSLIRFALSSALRHDGHEVTAVATGGDAVTAMNNASFDICFLDVHLPDANGLELMKTIRSISPAIRIIIMTAQDLEEEQMDDLRRDGCQFLPKPFDLEHVRSLVAEAGNPLPPVTRATSPAARR